MSGVTATLDDYREPCGPDVVDQLRQLGRFLEGRRVVHVNSTKSGGGVAEILARLVPLQQELGLRVGWEVIEGNPAFFHTTKAFHNGLQGQAVSLGVADFEAYQVTNQVNAERLRPILEEADFVFVHDPQPAALLALCPNRRGRWVWRCHIDLSHPARPVWKYLRDIVGGYDASIFSIPLFAQPLPGPRYLIMPSIDPLSDKNRALDASEMATILDPFGLDPERPVLLQVSRFDRFKDPVGVVRAWRAVRQTIPAQLVLAGGSADDDPEGAQVLDEVRAEVEGEEDAHLLLLPSDAHLTINALQRRADIVLQKSIREGFGLTVSEALWKRRPVIGGDTGGIRLQVIDRHTGFLVSSAEGAALRLRYLLARPGLRAEMGDKGQRFVRENFLLTRHLRDYLTLMLALERGGGDRLELD